ncbi:MAG TPA: hypothetical protein VGD17_16670, partial [Chitinophagaceae bacterium]
GISVNYKINDRFFLESGLVYSNIGYKTKSSDLEWIDQNNAYAVRSFTSYHHQFINVPVKLNYTFKGKRLKFFAGAGISVNRFIGTKTSITREYENGQKKTRSSRTQLLGTNSMNLSAIVSSGLNYQVSDRLYFKLEPVLRRSLTSIGHNSNSREYYYSIGINSALMYSLMERRKRK